MSSIPSAKRAWRRRCAAMVAIFSFLGAVLTGCLPGLGESFLSGTGNQSKGFCQRSDTAPPLLIPFSKTGGTLLVSCAGATVANLVSVPQGPGQAPQISYLNKTMHEAVVMIGGNDAGFVPLLNACIFHDSSVCFGQALQSLATLQHLQFASLPGLFKAMRARMAPHARIVIVGYPQIVPDPAVTNVVGCRALQLAPGLLFDRTEVGFARYVTAHLDLAIRQAAIANGVTYVQPNNFIGHELCTRTPWFFGISVSNINGIFHPNRLGEQGIANTIAPAL